MAALVSRQHVYTIKTKTSHLENWNAFFVRQQAAWTILIFFCHWRSFTEVTDQTLKLYNEGQNREYIYIYIQWEIYSGTRWNISPVRELKNKNNIVIITAVSINYGKWCFNTSNICFLLWDSILLNLEDFRNHVFQAFQE